MSTRLPSAQRRALDAYYTPDVLAELLVSLLPLPSTPLSIVLDPHVGGGAFARAFSRVGAAAYGMDINPNAPGKIDCLRFIQGDFLSASRLGLTPGDRADLQWIVGNPPYSDAEAHVRRALEVSERHVAFLLRLAFLETAKRLPFWQEHPCRKVFVLSSRPSFTNDGRHDSAAYGFFWWDQKHTGPTELEVLDTRSTTRRAARP